MLAALGVEPTGVDGLANPLGLQPVRRACVLLVDGLGWELLGQHSADAPVLTELAKRAVPLRVGVPATTAAGIAAIGTGVPSGEHGMVGYTFALPEIGVLNTLGWCTHGDGERTDLRQRAVPELVQPQRTTFERAEAAGVATSVLSSAAYAGSGMTRASLRGGTYVGVHAIGDLAAGVLEALRPAPSFCYAYHPDLDMLGHRFGPGSLAWRMQLRQIDRLVESIVEDLPGDSMLAVVADHGMVAVADDCVDADETPALWHGVRALAGEVRMRHVYAEPGVEADVLAAWRETLGDRAWVLGRDEAIAQGWFGPRVTDAVRPRIGDVVAAMLGRFGVLRGTAELIESSLIGHHGSITSAEQLVPLLVAYG
ncbi:MAG: alkaline phosphatase family protein [Pseudonocardiaceae bacterium]|nr:alkaline phosphatase family protein [Pseudonocardiaceae bacterium]